MRLVKQDQIEELLKDLDIPEGSRAYNKLLAEGMAMSELEYNFETIEEALEDKLDLMGLGELEY